jgi:hypothetical protein
MSEFYDIGKVEGRRIGLEKWGGRLEAEYPKTAIPR